nr:ROK family protein [uncultured Sphingomonas sp.]
MSAAPLVAGVEIGGTKCIAILGRTPGDVVEEVRIDTAAPGPTLAALEALLERWQAEHGFSAIGVASFGPLRLDPAAADHGAIVSTPKPGWSGTDVLRRWAGFGVPVALEVDVIGAALAEQRWGGAQGLLDFVYITVGTGIGVGPIITGRPVAARGHCELGHARVPRLAGDVWPGACPFHGDCVEGLASGAAIAARAGTARPAADWDGWKSVEHALAMLLHNLLLGLQTRRVLIGGGVMEARPALVAAIGERLRASLAGYYTAADLDDGFLAPPALGARAGPLGALALGLSALDA